MLQESTQQNDRYIYDCNVTGKLQSCIIPFQKQAPLKTVWQHVARHYQKIPRCILRCAISKEIFMDVLYALESNSVYSVNYKAQAPIVRGALRRG